MVRWRAESQHNDERFTPVDADVRFGNHLFVQNAWNSTEMLMKY